MSSRDAPMENIRACCTNRCLESGQGSKEFPLRCKAYSRIFFFFQKHSVTFVKNGLIEHFSSYHFEDDQKVSDCLLQFQCRIADKFQSHKVKLKKSVTNYGTKGISDIAVHLNF